jgi:hypothetical protein
MSAGPYPQPGTTLEWMLVAIVRELFPQQHEIDRIESELGSEYATLVRRLLEDVEP